LEKELGITLQHAHYSTSCDSPSMRDEYKIPNTNYRVDAFDRENKVIYEYHGNHVHGYPPNHAKYNDISTFTKKLNSKMYEKTMNRMKFISEITHFKVKFIWGHEYDKIKKTTQSLMSIIHEYKDE
jgi:hypothetical protein